MRARPELACSAALLSGGVPSDRDLFANFERMRREMDELFGDVFGGAPGGRSHRGAFSPAVDVYYVADPPRAVVHAELAGVPASEIELEIRGRELILAGQRRPPDAEEERLYQQLEIQHGAVPARRSRSAPTSTPTRPRRPTRTAS